MFDIGWSELLVLGCIALIVVGPKDLPGMLRNLGRYAAKARSMAREFQRSMEDAAREADLGELRDVQKSMREFDGKISLDGSSKSANKTKKPKKKSGAAATEGAAGQDGAGREPVAAAEKAPASGGGEGGEARADAKPSDETGAGAKPAGATQPKGA